MIVKRCNYCGNNIPIGKKCNCIAQNICKSSSDSKYTKEDKKFYKSSDWLNARKLCIQKCCGIDLYSYYILHRIEYGQTVHHIVPLLNDYSLRLSQDNLIYLTESNHRIIHKLYESKYTETIEVLRTILRDFGYRGVAKKLL